MADEMLKQGESTAKRHDRGYKNVFSNKDSFLHFLSKYVKTSWVSGITADNLEQINTSFVMKDYNERESDVIYKLKDGNVYFYVLLELQSTPDFSMPFRLLQYMTNLLANEFKNSEDTRETKNFKLPAIVPIVLYNGESSWTPVRSYKEYTANYENFGNNIIDFEYILFDLNRYNQEEILSTRKLLDYIFTMDLNHHSRSFEDLRREFQKLAKLPHELTDDDIKTLVSWLANVIHKGQVDENFEKEAVEAFRKGDVEVMTYAINRMVERESAVAAEKAIENHAVSMAKRMLKRNKPIEEIMEFTGLTREQVEILR